MAKFDADPTAVVVGRGPSGASAALALAEAGATVTLLAADDWLMPGADGVLGVPALLEAARHPRIELLTGASYLAREQACSQRWLHTRPHTDGKGLSRLIAR